MYLFTDQALCEADHASTRLQTVKRCAGADGPGCLQAENKAALQKELSLPERPDVPLIGFIGRLDYQKGADLVLGAVPWLMEQDVQLVCLGTGDVSLEVRALLPCIDTSHHHQR